MKLILLSAFFLFIVWGLQNKEIKIEYEKPYKIERNWESNYLPIIRVVSFKKEILWTPQCNPNQYDSFKNSNDSEFYIQIVHKRKFFGFTTETKNIVTRK